MTEEQKKKIIEDYLNEYTKDAEKTVNQPDKLEKLLIDPEEEAAESVCAAVIGRLRELELTDGGWDFLEPHAYEIMARIRDPEIAALHVMEG